jgi:tripeptidyl-peptidase-1
VPLQPTLLLTPLPAAVISLVNDARLAAGKPVLGFLNPRLYAGVGAAALNDITSGSSAGCNTAGFPAAKGWDAVTGFGSECGVCVPHLSPR